ncbi:MAG TPA: hypothetical protein PLC52_03055 [Anaerolineales bacterium]|nr:hypothetical protein [Anaerolineales bacterium]HRQ91832.1 hypothetical protein [Anaerolineales bacterium]
MPGLEHSLEGHDLAYLRSVADIWRIELDAPDARATVRQLAGQLAQQAAELELLPAACLQALQALAAQGGRMAWVQFIRTYGELREMGAARIEKERPQRTPVSVTEQLWYRGLVGRAFFDTPDGPLEFAYIPDEILAALPKAASASANLGRPARPDERLHIIPVMDAIVNEACSLLAVLRTGQPVAWASELEGWRTETSFLLALLQAAGLVDAAGKVNATLARNWLEMERADALLTLAEAWLGSDTLNELRLLPGLTAEGGWQNDSKGTRSKVLAWLQAVPQTQWWSVPVMIADVKQRQPAFQRPGGDFDAWYLRAEDGRYLRGFEHWDAVDGALLRYFITGPLHWLGFIELASSNDEAAPLAFRWSAWSQALLHQQAPALPKEQTKLKVDSFGQITAAKLTPRAVRYQVARFCTWLPPRKGNYQYQLSAAGLQAARQQGLQAAQLQTLLQAQAGNALPPNVLQALRRWQQNGAQAQLAPRLVLRVQSAAALKALRASRASRWLGELLGPLAISVKPGAGHQVLQALVELGYLGELEDNE